MGSVKFNNIGINDGKKKYLRKKEMGRLRMVNKVIKKHIDIKSNIGINDLEIKLRTINNFHTKGFKTDVLVKHLRYTTSLDAYNLFLNMLSTRLRLITSFLVGPKPTENGNNVFHL
ncbi:hypothetical protein [Candidatus Hodgkinia cicadicola]|uniref:hypothetical protein n=1 Tax=Candidatus Hodgkinia cicadicola TaxID=573658 RepID=UPI0011BA6542